MTFEQFEDPHTIGAALVAIATFATIVTIAMPLLSTDQLDKRMRSVATERERIRAREREKLNASTKSIRYEPKAYMKRIVDRFNLKTWLGTEKSKDQMLMAGYRGAQAEVAFLFFRLVSPAVFFVLGLLYIFFVANFSWPITIKIGAVIACTYLGIKAPELVLANKIKKRQLSVTRAFPDALDLLLICVESGMSIEQAFRRVSQEIGLQSVPLAEELTLTTAELSYLPERRTAYENFAKRTGLDSTKQIVTVLTQAEKYGTPLGHALRVLGQESRDARLMLAEQKAAALPPKLTVPMIVFFLPVLFAVILTPAIVQIYGVIGGK
jgi:tight adherence protein C